MGGEEEEAESGEEEEDDGFVMADDVVLLEDGTEVRTQPLPQRREAHRRIPLCGPAQPSERARRLGPQTDISLLSPLSATLVPFAWPLSKEPKKTLLVASTPVVSKVVASVVSESSEGAVRVRKPRPPLPAILLDCVRSSLGTQGLAGTKKEIVDILMSNFVASHPNEPRPSRSATERALNDLAEKKQKLWSLKPAPKPLAPQSSINAFF